MDKLPKCEANFSPLTPITFLQRAAAVYSDRTSIIYETTRFTWNQTHDRCRRLASSLRSLDISKNDVVSVLAPNVPALCELHFAIPMSGAVINPINTRLNANGVATILMHSEAKAFFVHQQYLPLASEALNLVVADAGERYAPDQKLLSLVMIIDDDTARASTPTTCAKLHYEQLIALGDPCDEPHRLVDEWDAISLNYTSGTTAAPKGVVCSHRGAYLSTLALLLQWEVEVASVYLWTLPMFHCNGWTFTWGIAARGGTNVCVRSPTAAAVHRAIADHGVTHMCAAPVVLNTILDDGRHVATPVRVLTGGSPPPPPLVEGMERLGFRVSHAYGLTEATGPALVCEWPAEWNLLPIGERSRLKVRQGVGVLALENVDVKDSETMESVARDGKTTGEIMLKGSSIMKGYLKDGKATAEAFKSGWFRTGDVGVVHPDGYVEVKDRRKDVIISGGENISSVEVETVLHQHPAVREAAVVAMPHRHWGETPCAFISLVKSGKRVSEEEIVAYCKDNMAGFMVPRKVVVMDELPKFSLKVQKGRLREMAKNLEEPSHGPAAQHLYKDLNDGVPALRAASRL